MARIFLCHASEDKPQVREVYHRLAATEEFEPWLDEEDLIPGQDWAYEIPLALKASEFILIFFSRNSVAKRGYVQREMKMALDALQEMPIGEIFTIPVRLDECEVPEPFRRYRYANLFDPRGFDRLVTALHRGLEQRGEQVPDSLETPPDNPKPPTTPPAIETEPQPPSAPDQGEQVTPSDTTEEVKESLPSQSDTSVSKEPVASPPDQKADLDSFMNSASDGETKSDPPEQDQQESESPTPQRIAELSLSAQKPRRLSVVTIVSLAIAAVGAMAAVFVVPEVRHLFKLPMPARESSLTTELKQTQIAPTPLLDFRFKNEKIEIPSKWPKSVRSFHETIYETKSITIVQMTPKIRMDLITVDFPTKDRQILYKKDLNMNLILPIQEIEELRIYPPDFEWDVSPLFELLRHYLRDKIIEPNSESYEWNQRAIISLDQKYTSFGKTHSLVGIYSVEYEVHSSNYEGKTSHHFVIKNISLIRNIEPNEKRVDVLNRIFESESNILKN